MPININFGVPILLFALGMHCAIDFDNLIEMAVIKYSNIWLFI
jgi:hypothetical protein